MTGELLELQKVQDFHSIYAIDYAFFKMRTVACAMLFSYWPKWRVLILWGRHCPTGNWKSQKFDPMLLEDLWKGFSGSAQSFPPEGLEFSFWAIFLGGSHLIPFIRRRQAMGEDVYLKLREFMNTLPAGYPSTPSGVEIRILKKLFSPEEAEPISCKKNCLNRR